jgi:hypothetical protein
VTLAHTTVLVAAVQCGGHVTDPRDCAAVLSAQHHGAVSAFFGSRQVEQHELTCARAEHDRVRIQGVQRGELCEQCADRWRGTLFDAAIFSALEHHVLVVQSHRA